MRNTNFLRAIVSEDEGNKILVDLKTLIEWNIIPKCFPLPMDPRDRVRSFKEADDIPKKMVDIKECVGPWRTDIKFAQISEEEFEQEHEKRCLLT